MGIFFGIPRSVCWHNHEGSHLGHLLGPCRLWVYHRWSPIFLCYGKIRASVIADTLRKQREHAKNSPSRRYPGQVHTLHSRSTCIIGTQATLAKNQYKELHAVDQDFILRPFLPCVVEVRQVPDASHFSTLGGEMEPGSSVLTAQYSAVLHLCRTVPCPLFCMPDAAVAVGSIARTFHSIVGRWYCKVPRYESAGPKYLHGSTRLHCKCAPHDLAMQQLPPSTHHPCCRST
jgi:hypothetical protein